MTFLSFHCLLYTNTDPILLLLNIIFFLLYQAAPVVDNEAIVNALDKRFFDSHFDPLQELVAQLPTSQGALDSFLQEEKARQQQKLDAVQARLSREVMANYQSFVDGMRHMNEIDMDVSRAGIHVANSLRKLQNARMSLAAGTLGITYRRRRRERLAEVRSRIEWIRGITRIGDVVDKLCAQNLFADAIQCVFDAQAKLDDAFARSFAVAGTVLRSKVAIALDTVCSRVDQALEAQCTQFSAPTYAAVLLALRTLDAHGVKARMHRNNAAQGIASSTAVTGSDGSTSSSAATALVLRERAGTTDDFDFFDASSGGAAAAGFLVSSGGGGLDDSMSGSIMDAGMFDGGMSPSGVPSTIGNGSGGQSILQEMGASIAASQATASTGITTVKNVGPADGNVANLPFLLQRAAASAVKSISKDVVIDIILKDLRKAMEAEKAKNEEIERFGISLDDDILGGGDDDEDEEIEQVGASAEKKNFSTSKKKKSGQLSPSVEYASKREELRMRPFDDICRLLSVKSPSTSSSASFEDGGASSSSEKDASGEGNSDLLNAAFAVCSACLHVMHQHYLILQWHRAPFDARNNHPEQEFLHRCGLDEIDPSRGESDLETAAVVAVTREAASAHEHAMALINGKINRTSALATLSSSSQLAIFATVLRQLHPFLLRSRAQAWANMQQRFGAVLLSAVGGQSLNVPIEGLAQLLVLARDLMAVGVEYVGHGISSSSSSSSSNSSSAADQLIKAATIGGGSGGGENALNSSTIVVNDEDPCSTVRGSLRLLCSQYMDAIHADCFGKLKDLLAKESWQALPPMANYNDAQGSSSSSSTSATISSKNASSPASAFTSFVDNLAGSGALKSRFSKSALKSLSDASAAIIHGAEAIAGSGLEGMSSVSAADNSGEAGADGVAAEAACAIYRSYSDGASLFSSWLDRGNPFGFLMLSEKLGGSGGAGSTVLSIPRPAINREDEDEDDEEFDDEEEDQGDAANEDDAIAVGGTSALRSSSLAEKQRQREQHKLQRLIHGDGYLLEVGLGRGARLGIQPPGVSDERRGKLSGKANADDDDDDEDDDEEIVDSVDGDDDGDDDDDENRSRRLRKGQGGDDERHGGLSGDHHKTNSSSAGPFFAAFQGQHQHTVTQAALNGFAKAVGKYTLLMEVLPTVGADAFTGLARLFELYLYTVTTLFLFPPALKQLYDVTVPQPLYYEKGDRPTIPGMPTPPPQFDFVDGAAYTIAARVANAICEARDYDRNSQSGGKGSSSSSFSSSSSSSSSNVTMTPNRRGGATAGRDSASDERVSIYGVQVYTRGLAAMAQTQGLSHDFYSEFGQGAEIGAVIGGGSHLSEGVFITLRRAIQLIGNDLSYGARGMSTSSTSVLAAGELSQDTTVSRPGIDKPEPFVRLQSPAAAALPGSIGGPGVEIEGEAVFFGAVERSVAVESLDFLIDILSRSRSRIETHLATGGAAPHAQQSVNNFFVRAVLCVTQLRGLIYKSLVPRIFPESGAVPNMINEGKLKWDAVKDAMEPSRYASTELTSFVQRAGSMLAERLKDGLPAVSRFGIWSCIVSHLNERFVEGFSRVKKCSVPGRGLMSLDAGTVFAVCCRAGPVLPALLARDRTFVDSYLSAFYFEGEADLLDWVTKNRSAYTLRSVRALVNSGIGANLKAKAKKELLTAIDALWVVPLPEEGSVERKVKEGAALAGYGLVAMGASMLAT